MNRLCKRYGTTPGNWKTLQLSGEREAAHHLPLSSRDREGMFLTGGAPEAS